ncbi:MAG: HdeD family acid-resistance protein [Eubacterium sp.]
MREFFGKIKNLSIITIIASAVMGIVLLIRPGETLYVVSMICGITMIALGIGALISYFVKDRNTFLIILAVIAIISGIIVCVKYKSIVSILLFLFGLFILISGVVDLITSIDVKRYGFGDWIVSFLLSVATAVLGLLIVINPFSSSLAVIRLLGISLIVYAVLDLIAFIQVKRVAKAVEEAVIDIEPSQIEADAREVDE